MKMYYSILTILFLALSMFAQRTNPGSAVELAEITERGRMLYSYDQAAWHSTDAVLALSPPKDSFERYVAQEKDGRWIVAYGKLNAARDKFLISYEAKQGATPKDFTVTKLDPAKVDTGFNLLASLAVDLATKDFGTVNRPYNVAVLPAKSKQFYVYLLPAQTKVGVFPLGADVRYLISADGSKIVEKRQLHKSVIEFAPPAESTPQMGYHIAILDDIPEDTDVFHVLARQPSIPEWVVTNKYVYQVKPDGSVIYVMTREAFLKIGKPSN